jgi:hypothetical protein
LWRPYLFFIQILSEGTFVIVSVYRKHMYHWPAIMLNFNNWRIHPLSRAGKLFSPQGHGSVGRPAPIVPISALASRSAV